MTDLRDWRTFLVPEGEIVPSLETLQVLLSVVAVPTGEVVITTSRPGQRLGEPSERVVDGPGDDEIVVDHHQEGDHQHPVAETRSYWSHSGEDLERRYSRILSQAQL